MARVSASGAGFYLRHSGSFAKVTFDENVQMGAFEEGLQIDEVIVPHLGKSVYLFV